MKAYVQSIDSRAWLVIQNRPGLIPNNSDGKKLVKRASIFDYTKEQLENIHGDANRVKEIESTSTLEESENSKDQEDLVVIPRTRKRKSRKKQNRKSQSVQNHQKNQKNEVQQQENICCYKCGKPGHMKLKCPIIKKKNHRISTWSDEDDQEEMINICLKKKEETDEACFNAILDCDLKKNNHKSWSDEDEYEEENNHKKTENQYFMAMGEINKDDIELVLNGYKKVLNEYNNYKSTEKGSTGKRPTLNKLTEEISKLTYKAAAGLPCRKLSRLAASPHLLHQNITTKKLTSKKSHLFSPISIQFQQHHNQLQFSLHDNRNVCLNRDGKKLVKRASIFDYTKEQLDIIQTNAREINMLYCAISEEEYKRISTCETAKDIWDRLENIHGDANKVKEIESTSTLEESENGEDREDLVVIPRTRKRKSRKKQNRKSQSIQNHQKNQKNEVQQQENICCYKCSKPRHIKLKCPNIKKKNHRILTWSDEDDQKEMTNICLKKKEETDEACFNAILDCDLKKNNHKSWSYEDEYEEENNHKRIENKCFMAMGEINKDDIELVLNGCKKVLNEYNKLRKEKKNWEIQLEEYKKLTHEKKDWEIQLEEYNKLRNEKND
ncbi:uncharacterized protein [Nicotiana sylvestris]|uniref:uncharacterized protein n=1 Tax=Nicotiana sylvestris TaxID=4096 RepID=UPI00388C7D99